jgi:cellulose synthase/poly-beta-1,6-N-acetylglucosamine synthase-like glycosyltransferase
VSALAFLVKNHVRPTGLQRLGLPCNLMGTGMAFPWHVVLAAPPAGSHLAEDMQMGLALVARGFAPTYCETACITSAAPKGSPVARQQRRRWEHGHISTMLEKGPKLIFGGLWRRKWLEAAMGLDLMVPPLALMALLLTVALTLSFGWSMAGGSRLPLELAAAGIGLYVGGVSIAWLKFGREILPARHLLSVPLYIAWKLPLYLSFIARGAYPHWDRTERSSSAI